jgi:hypothetical protein
MTYTFYIGAYTKQDNKPVVKVLKICKLYPVNSVHTEIQTQHPANQQYYINVKELSEVTHSVLTA